MSDDLLLYAVGDIAPEREEPISIFKNVKKLLKGDIVLVSLRQTYKKGNTFATCIHARREVQRLLRH